MGGDRRLAERVRLGEGTLYITTKKSLQLAGDLTKVSSGHFETKY
jgi:hypothetical protein